MAKELLFSVTRKDLNIDWYSGSGAGGQHRNKHQNCCRIRHIESGAIVTAQEERSRQANLKRALNRLAENVHFKIWMNKKIYDLSEQAKKDKEEIERKIENALRPENIKIEYIEDTNG